MASNLRKLTDHLLGGELDRMIADGRGRGWSWELIAREIWILTGREICVTGQTVNNWASEEVKSA